MTMFNLYLSGVDITKISSNISLSDNIDALGVELSFDITREFFDKVELGNIVVLKVDGVIIFQGIIVSRNIQEFTTSCTCFDFAWYLNKSTVVRQYKGIKGIEAIKELCTDVGVKINIEGVEGTIDCIYKDKTIIDIIRDILNKSTQINGKKFNLEMIIDVLHIQPLKKLLITPIYQLSDKDTILVADNIGNVNYSDSIDELKNSIIVVSGDDKALRHIGEAKDEKSIEKYGMIQSVISLDAKDYNNANEIAKTKLKELNNVAQNISLLLLGNFQIKSGRVITLNIPKYNLNGDYLIKSSSHSFDNKIHTVNINVEVFNDE